jgi:hypothetical protein
VLFALRFGLPLGADLRRNIYLGGNTRRDGTDADCWMLYDDRPNERVESIVYSLLIRRVVIIKTPNEIMQTGDIASYTIYVSKKASI